MMQWRGKIVTITIIIISTIIKMIILVTIMTTRTISIIRRRIIGPIGLRRGLNIETRELGYVLLENENWVPLILRNLNKENKR